MHKFLLLIKTYRMPLISILLFSLSFPPFNLFFLSYFALLPILYDIHFSNTISFKHRFKKGFIFGSASMAIFHSWFFELTAFAPLIGIIMLWLGLSCYLGLFYGLCFGLYHRFDSVIRSTLWFSSIWTIFEFLRSCGPIGNSAAAIGYSQTHFPAILQLSSLFGIFGVSFFCMIITMLIFHLLIQKKSKDQKKPSSKRILSTVAILFCLIISFGTYQIKVNSDTPPNTPICIVQPNHPQKLKLDSSQRFRLYNDFIRLTKKALHTESNIALMIFPETITPSLNTRKSGFIDALINTIESDDTHLLFGTPILEEKKYYNSVVSLSKSGLSKNRYDKVKLMPFGEYWPFRPLLRRLGLEDMIGSSDYSVGKYQQPLLISGYKIGSGICLESIYPWYYRKQVKHGAQILIALVNNAWFFDSKAAEQHIQMSQVRAVENGRYLLQSANTGISAIISPTGKIVQQTILNQQTLLHGKVSFLNTLTFYTQYGDLIIVLCLIIIGICLYVPTTGKKRKF